MVRRNEAPLERGTRIKKWHGKIPVCIVFPNSYYIGMSNLATHILYKVLNDMPDVVCERCFLAEAGAPLSVESKRPLSDFEILFFTISFELDYVNVPRILAASKVAVFASERRDGGPIVVAGGITVASNPEPLNAFMDLFLMGDIEATVGPFMDAYRETRGAAKPEIVDGLSAFDFAYNPEQLHVSYKDDGTIDSFAPPDFRVRIKRYRGKTLGASSIVSDATEFTACTSLKARGAVPPAAPSASSETPMASATTTPPPLPLPSVT